jgi:hypothetical protein
VITIEDVAKEVAKRTNLDIDLVSTICKHPFSYTVDLMKDVDETKDILFNELFKFKLKRRFKENKTNEYKSK